MRSKCDCPSQAACRAVHMRITATERQRIMRSNDLPIHYIMHFVHLACAEWVRGEAVFSCPAVLRCMDEEVGFSRVCVCTHACVCEPEWHRYRGWKTDPYLWRRRAPARARMLRVIWASPGTWVCRIDSRGVYCIHGIARREAFVLETNRRLHLYRLHRNE